MRGQKEVVEPQGVFELWQDVAVPCDQPGQGEYGAYLRSGVGENTKRKMNSVALGFDKY